MTALRLHKNSARHTRLSPVSDREPTDEELREFEEAVKRAEEEGIFVDETDEEAGTHTVFFVTPEQLERMKHLFED